MLNSHTGETEICSGNIYFLPSLHGRMEFGLAVRELFSRIKPDAIALELPPTIKSAVMKGVERLPFLSVVLYEEKDGRHVYMPLEPQDAMMTAASLGLKKMLPVYFIDRDTEGYPRHFEPMPDPYLVKRLGLPVFAENYRTMFLKDQPDPEDRLRETTMAAHLIKLGEMHERVLFVCGLAHYPRIRRLLNENPVEPLSRTHRDGITLANLHKDSSREIMSEMPFLAARFVEKGIEDGEVGLNGLDSLDNLDRLELHQELISQAQKRYAKNFKEEVTRSQLSVLNRFGRNYALLQGGLVPDLYQLLIAARGAVDDNFAYELWDEATTYPFQDENSNLPDLRLRGEDLFLNQRRIQFYRRFKQTRRRLVSMPVKKRKREKNKGEWAREWEGKYICSYPPEDLIIEGYGDFLKKKATRILSEQGTRSVPFQASMLDGIDFRETVRNWAEKKIYVIESSRISGKFGSVVVIFDEDLPLTGVKERFPWCMSWLGENNQESDMALYATEAGSQVIGPGISQCEYGGFMMTYPPLRLSDIWRDEYFDRAQTKAERLLMAAVDYSEEKYIAYIAADPPSSKIRSWANLYGKKVIYIPKNQFSSLMLKKIRIFHVLDGHHVREYAHEYIF